MDIPKEWNPNNHNVDPAVAATLRPPQTTPTEALPEVGGIAIPTAPPPGSGPHPAPGPVPASWQDPIRIIRVVLDLAEVDIEEARRIHDWAQAKLEQIRQGR